MAPEARSAATRKASAASSSAKRWVMTVAAISGWPASSAAASSTSRAVAVPVGAVGHGPDPRELLGERHRAGCGQQPVVDAEQHDPPAWPSPLGARSQPGLRTRRLDHRIVLTAGRPGTEPLPGLALVGVAGLEVDLVTEGPEPGHGQQADRAPADDDHPLTGA